MSKNAINKLTTVEVEAARGRERPYKLADGGGLYLLVNEDGRRYWRIKYRIDGREKLLSLGVYPEVTVKRARLLAAEARKLKATGVDPSQERQSAKAKRRDDATNTLEAVAREWVAKETKRCAWSPSHRGVVLRRLENDVFGRLGPKPITSVMHADLLAVLKRVEERGALESAHRVRQYLDSTFRYAMATHRVPANPTPATEELEVPDRGRFAAVTDAKSVGALLRAIDGYSGSHVVRTALKLAPMLFVRPGELRAAEWTEFDLDVSEWMIPAERMKMRRSHLVPLSKRAVALLSELHDLTGQNKYVFPSERGRGRPMSENTLKAALDTLGYKGKHTAHGFRHMASTLLHDSRKFRSEVIERQLAHADTNSIRAIYNAAEYLDERVQMMQWWSDRLEALAAVDNVLSLSGRKKA
jgi:integrase